MSIITNSTHPPKTILQPVQANNYRQLHPPEHVRTNPIVQLSQHLEFSMFQFPIPFTTDKNQISRREMEMASCQALLLDQTELQNIMHLFVLSEKVLKS